MNKTLMKILVAFLLLFITACPLAVASDSINEGKNPPVTGETVKGPQFYGGDIVQIDGTVDGLTFAAGREVRVNGTIRGDLFVAAKEVIVNGNVTGNLYTAGQFITIGGQVQGDTIGAGQRVTTTKEALLGRDALLAAEKIIHTGVIQRQLKAAAGTIQLNGVINDDSHLETENLELLDKTVIGGKLTYYSPNQAVSSPGAKVTGPVDWQKSAPVVKEKRPVYVKELGHFFLSLASAILLWFLVQVWRPRFWKETAQHIGEKPLKVLGFGALALIVTPIAAILIMITVIGIPLGIILALTYGLFLYLSKIIVAVFIGGWLAARFGWPELHKGVWLVLLGLAILSILTKIPVLGFFVGLAVVFAGLGALLLRWGKPNTAPESI